MLICDCVCVFQSEEDKVDWLLFYLLYKLSGYMCLDQTEALSKPCRTQRKWQTTTFSVF